MRLGSSVVRHGRWHLPSLLRGLLAATLVVLFAAAPAEAAAKKAAKTSDDYTVDLHGSMPTPRPGQHSHHGVMSAWMHQHYPKSYDPDHAPAILMPKPMHEKTFGVYLKWRSAAAKKMGGTFDWKKVSEAEMQKLSEQMFDAAKVPQPIRKQYWGAFAKYRASLKG